MDDPRFNSRLEKATLSSLGPLGVTRIHRVIVNSQRPEPYRHHRPQDPYLSSIYFSTFNLSIDRGWMPEIWRS